LYPSFSSSIIFTIFQQNAADQQLTVDIDKYRSLLSTAESKKEEIKEKEDTKPEQVKTDEKKAWTDKKPEQEKSDETKPVELKDETKPEQLKSEEKKPEIDKKTLNDTHDNLKKRFMHRRFWRRGD